MGAIGSQMVTSNLKFVPLEVSDSMEKSEGRCHTHRYSWLVANLALHPTRALGKATTLSLIC